jgi:hypothetical protein
MSGGASREAGCPGARHAGAPIRLPGSRLPEPGPTHDARTDTHTSLEPMGFGSEGAPLHAWQLYDER